MCFALRQSLGCLSAAIVLLVAPVYSQEYPSGSIPTTRTWEPFSGLVAVRAQSESATSPATSPHENPPTAFNSSGFRGNPPSPGYEFADFESAGGEEQPRSLATFLGYDSWRGHPDGGWGHNGLHTGLNFGTRLGRLSEWTGVGMQVGGSIGVYDWSGTDYRWSRQDESETQGFVTYGFFRKAAADSPWSAAIVQDWMINDNYSVFAQNPTMYQWRAQLGYTVSDWTEFGVWGTFRGEGDTKVVNGYGTVTWRPIQQLNPYWHRKWGPGGGDTWIWVGVPERNRLTGAGSLGDYTVGVAANCPLSDRLALYTLVTYMHPSASPGPDAAREDAWNFYVGVSFYPGRNARTLTLFDRNWLPQLPVANNGYFLVDASDTY